MCEIIYYNHFEELKQQILSVQMNDWKEIFIVLNKQRIIVG